MAMQPKSANQVIITTTPNIEGFEIEFYCGLVTGTTLLGINIFRDMVAGIQNVLGDRVAGYEKELDKARQTAISEMQEKAYKLGASAIVGVEIDYESIAKMLLVCVSGTAVKIK